MYRLISIFFKDPVYFQFSLEKQQLLSYIKWIGMPTGEQPLKKKTMRLKTYPNGWCGKSLTFVTNLLTYNEFTCPLDFQTSSNMPLSCIMVFWYLVDSHTALQAEM